MFTEKRAECSQKKSKPFAIREFSAGRRSSSLPKSLAWKQAKEIL